MSRLSVTVSALALIGVLASNPAEAVQRVFVASFGSDANAAVNCTLVNPCRGFTAAMTVVDSGGEVVALDAAGYGVVTITKSVTITANPGFYAGISASTGNAVTINTAVVNVILRGLNINGVGGNIGVSMTDGNMLSIENCVISNFGDFGIFVSTEATVRIIDSIIRDGSDGIYLQGSATATISGTKLLGNSGRGIWASGAVPSTTATAAISDSIVSGNLVGILASASDAASTARASVTRSTVSNNSLFGIAASNGSGTQMITVSNNLVTGNLNGLGQLAGGGPSVVRSLGNNTVDQNGSNTSGTITTISGM